MPPHQVSPAIKASVNRQEMDAALAKLLARPQGLRIARVDTASQAFLCMSTSHHDIQMLLNIAKTCKTIMLSVKLWYNI